MKKNMLVEKMFEKQKSDYLSRGGLAISERKSILRRLINILIDNREIISKALQEDFSSRSEVLTEFSDINPSVQNLKSALKNLDKWTKPRKVATTPTLLGLIGAKAYIEFQAKGVIGVLSPWNFPINLTFGPLAGIIAAGNRAMIKPSELTPKTSELIEKLISDNFDPSIICVINGGIDTAAEFSRLPFDHLMFTGATSIGKKIMAVAAENLVPVTLELGGKSPAIVSDSADIELAAKRIISGKLMNAGQVCLAPDYVLINKSQLRPFIDALIKTIETQYKTILSNSEYTSIINERHFKRLKDYIDQATKSGCEIIEINPANEKPTDTDCTKILPTLLINPSTELNVMKDEIFGPILPIITMDNVKQSIDFINARPRPLALYYFGKDAQEKDYVLKHSISGGVTINDVIFHIAMENLPFGGIGASGIGAYHGHRGFLEFSHQRSVYQQLPKDNFLLRAFRPPYGNIIKNYLNFEMRK